MRNTRFLIVPILCLSLSSVFGQSSVMIKAYDKELNPIKGIGVSLDGGAMHVTDANGAAFVEDIIQPLPPKSIKLNRDQFEAESWNYSKGILEVIIRRKSYRMTTLNLRNRAGAPLEGQEFLLNTPKPIKKTSDASGKVEVPMPLQVDPITSNLISVPGFTIIDRQVKRGVVNLVLEPNVTKVAKSQTVIQDNFDVTELDSIQSLTVFYGYIKNIDIQKLSDELKARIDSKFYELIAKASDSIRLQFAQNPVGRISDSTLVLNDVTLLIEQARNEEQSLVKSREEFDEQIKFIDQKLKDGGGNLNESSRQELLQKIQELDRILTTNSEYFTKSTSDYHSILTAMRNRLLNIQELEDKLTDVQHQRELEREAFQQRLLIISLIVAGLAFLLFILLFLIRKINRQRKTIKKAHRKVRQVNEHLEELVDQRTLLLKKTNEELDTFMYRSSHDLRRPLTSMLGLVEVARMTLGADALELFERVAGTAQSMDRMLQKLIMVSHINQPSETKSVDISLLPEKYQQRFEEFMKQSGVSIDWNLQPGMQHETCPVMLDIIIRNLLENALRFSACVDAQIKPPVRVNMHMMDDNLILEVEDHAGGISPEVQPKIWNMFYVGNEASKGNGLGLYVTRRAVDKLGATIDFKCSGKSTLFTVRIPSSKVKKLKVPELVAV